MGEQGLGQSPISSGPRDKICPPTQVLSISLYPLPFTTETLKVPISGLFFATNLYSNIFFRYFFKNIYDHFNKIFFSK